MYKWIYILFLTDLLYNWGIMNDSSAVAQGHSKYEIQKKLSATVFKRNYNFFTKMFLIVYKEFLNSKIEHILRLFLSSLNAIPKVSVSSWFYHHLPGDLCHLSWDLFYQASYHCYRLLTLPLHCVSLSIYTRSSLFSFFKGSGRIEWGGLLILKIENNGLCFLPIFSSPIQ